MPEIHHFQAGAVHPAIAYVMSVLGLVLGLVFAARARRAHGRRRTRLTGYAALAIGGPGVWLAHFIALLGFDVPRSDLRIDPLLTAVSAALAVGGAGGGLYLTRRGNPTVARLAAAGLVTGAGFAAMYVTGTAAVRFGGMIKYALPRLGLTLALAVLAGTLVVGFTAYVDRRQATWGAAAVAALSVAGLHYAGMASVRVELFPEHAGIEGLNPMFLLPPVVIIGGSLLALLAFVLSGHAELAKMRATGPAQLSPPPSNQPTAPLPPVGLPPRYPPDLRLSGRHWA